MHFALNFKHAKLNRLEYRDMYLFVKGFSFFKSISLKSNLALPPFFIAQYRGGPYHFFMLYWSDRVLSGWNSIILGGDVVSTGIAKQSWAYRDLNFSLNVELK